MGRGLIGEPGVLALGVAPRGDLAAGDDFGAGSAGGEFADPDGEHGGKLGVEVHCRQLCHFLARSLVEHCREAPVAAGDQPVAGGQQDQGTKHDLIDDAAFAMLMPMSEGSAGRTDDF